jgi:hypothetical protein
MAPLEYLKVKVSDNTGNVIIADGLVDSGAQMSVMHSDMVGGLDYCSVGRVKLRGIIGPSVEADVVKLNMRLASCSDNCEYISVFIAVSPDVNDKFVLPLEVVHKISSHVCLSNASVCTTGRNFGQ